jgi:Berberine and berberine like
LKGAGASFGVITEFVVRTHPEPGNVVQYTYSFSFGRQADMAPFYQKWQDLISDPNLDRRFDSEFIVEPLGALITTTFYGTDAEYQASGIPAKIPTGGRQSMAVNDWVGSIAHEAENEALYLSNIPTSFYSKSLALRQQDLLTPSGITDLFNYLDQVDKGTLVWFIIFDQSGGAIADVAEDATAYPHRDKILFYQSYAVGLPTLSDKTRSFLTGVHAIIQKNAAQANMTYAGYVDPALVGPDAQQSYWGPHVPRLQQIKKAWDPTDVFHNPASVKPAA